MRCDWRLQALKRRSSWVGPSNNRPYGLPAMAGTVIHHFRGTLLLGGLERSTPGQRTLASCRALHGRDQEPRRWTFGGSRKPDAGVRSPWMFGGVRCSGSVVRTPVSSTAKHELASALGHTGCNRPFDRPRRLRCESVAPAGRGQGRPAWPVFAPLGRGSLWP